MQDDSSSEEEVIRSLTIKQQVKDI